MRFPRPRNISVAGFEAPDASSGIALRNSAITIAGTGGIALPGTAAWSDAVQTLSATGGAWDPSKASVAPLVWYDSYHLTQVANVVTGLTDRSGNANNGVVYFGVVSYSATGWTSGGQPKFSTSASAINSGSNVTIGAFTMGVVFKTSSAADYLLVHGSTAGGTNKGSVLYPTNGSAVYANRGSATLTDARDVSSSGWGNDGNPHLAIYVFDGTNAGHLIYKDGSLQTMADVTNHNPGTAMYAALFNVGGQSAGIVADYVETWICNGVYNNTDLSNAHAYSQARWGTP